MDTQYFETLIELQDTLKSGGQIETQLQREALLHFMEILPSKRELHYYQECISAIYGTPDNKEALRHFAKRIEKFEARYNIFPRLKGL